jgi:hypothetical protein
MQINLAKMLLLSKIEEFKRTIIGKGMMIIEYL